MYLNAERKIYYRESDIRIKGSASEYDDDPRVTTIGKFLLKSGLDQLPELFNVLEGEMSIIGPRHPLEGDSIKSLNRKFS